MVNVIKLVAPVRLAIQVSVVPLDRQTARAVVKIYKPIQITVVPAERLVPLGNLAAQVYA